MKFIQDLMKNRFVQVIAVLILFIVGVFVFILAMPAMTDFQVYSILVTIFALVLIYYLYQKRKAEYEQEVREEYERFLEETKNTREKILPTPSDSQQWDQTASKDQPERDIWEE